MHDAVALALRLTAGDADTAEVLAVAAAPARAGDAGGFDSLIRTRGPLPYHLRVLFGLDVASLEAAPGSDEVAQRLESFLGNRPAVVSGGPSGVAALLRLVPSLTSPVIDLAELAELLLPGLPAYDTRGLASSFGLTAPLPADAAAEAAVAAGVYLKLCEQARRVDALLLEEVVLRTAASEWGLRFFFREAAEQAANSGRFQSSGEEGAIALPVALGAEPGRALTQNAERRHVQPDEVVTTLERAAGAGESALEPRVQQLEMSAAVTSALDQEYHLIVEAGTGTGKSLAYLLPAACLALRNNARVVVSTNTINLQEQIVNKDIPELQRLLREHGPTDLRGQSGALRTVTLKGRRNYLCLQRLTTLRRAPALTEAETRFLVRVLFWLAATQTGDRAELRLRPAEEALWNRVSAEGTNCFSSANYFVRNGLCQLLQSRRRAEAAHLVVVNHALLLSDVTSGRHILPNYDRLVVDEAHNLEDEATSQFGFYAGHGELSGFLDGVLARERERESGLVIDIRTSLRGAERPHADSVHLSELLTALVERTNRARERVPETFGRLRAFIQQHGQIGGDYDQRLLLTPAKRAQPEWMQVELAWDDLRLGLVEVEKGLERLAVALGEGSDEGIVERETLVGTVSGQQLAGRQLREGVEAIIDRHDSDRIAWLTVNRSSGTVSFSSAPLNVGEVLDSYLFSRKASVVLTSATLSTAGSFDYVRERLGLAEAEELAVGSPFDYRRAALLLLQADIPEPAAPQYQRALEQSVLELCTASRGRALVLFTSHSALRATYHAVRARLAAAGIRALAQGIDGTPRDLLAALRAEGRTVLLGTSSFWEGVDVAGEALSLLVIAKLPFSVPTDPVFTARAELFDEPFRDYALPQAVLRFKQGFGRLIRHRGDRGVVAVLDRRLRSKNYGRIFLDSLPDCTVKELPAEGLAAAVSDWLDRGPPAAVPPKRPRRVRH